MENTPESASANPETGARLARLKGGIALVALDPLKDPNFESTVVLVCVYTAKDGAYGLVLNRPTHMPVSEVFDGFAGRDVGRKFYIGGPVQQDVLQVLQITDIPQKESFQVATRVFMGGQWDNLEGILTNESEDLRVFLGYSGWSPGQLENEILAGAWDVYGVNVEKLLSAADEQLATGSEGIREYLSTLV